jgi:hypothetical protein
MSTHIKHMIIERMIPAPIRSNDKLMWIFDTKGELHTFVTKLNDLILNEIKYRDIKYVEERVVFSLKGDETKQIAMLTRDLTLTLFIAE